LTISESTLMRLLLTFWLFFAIGTPLRAAGPENDPLPDPIDAIDEASAPPSPPDGELPMKPTRKSAMRDAINAVEHEDFPGLIRALDRLIAFYPEKSHDRLLRKVELALQKVTDPQVIELLRIQVTDARVKQRLASRQLASAQVIVADAESPISYAAQISLEPSYDVGSYSVQNKQDLAIENFGSPSQFGVAVAASVPLSSRVELDLAGQYRQLRVTAPVGKTMSVTALSLPGFKMELGWYAGSRSKLRFSLRTEIASLPMASVSGTTVDLTSSLVPSGGIGLAYTFTLSEGAALTWGAFASYQMLSLSSQITAYSGLSLGSDLGFDFRLVDGLWLRLAGRFRSELTQSSLSTQNLLQGGGGLGLVYRFSR